MRCLVCLEVCGDISVIDEVLFFCPGRRWGRQVEFFFRDVSRMGKSMAKVWRKWRENLCRCVGSGGKACAGVSEVAGKSAQVCRKWGESL